MNAIGQAIAYSALVGAAVYLEMHGKPVDGLWILIVMWTCCTSWGCYKSKKEDK